MKLVSVEGMYVVVGSVHGYVQVVGDPTGAWMPNKICPLTYTSDGPAVPPDRLCNLVVKVEVVFVPLCDPQIARDGPAGVVNSQTENPTQRVESNHLAFLVVLVAAGVVRLGRQAYRRSTTCPPG